MPETDVFFTVHTKTNGPIICKYNTSDPYTLTRGNRANLELWVASSNQDLTVTTDTTIESGTTEVYDEIIVDGATLTINGTLQANTIDVINNGTIDSNDGTVNTLGSQGGFDLLRSYADFGGKYTTKTALDGTEKYREQIPSSADVSSIVFGIEPAQKLKDNDVSGIWGLIESGSDSRNRTLTTNSVEFSFVVLAEYSEYADHTDLENSLQI